MLSLPENKPLTGASLKWIAVLTMIVDHIGIVFFTDGDPVIYNTCRVVGRISFPLFCLLLTEGCLYTKNRKKYALSMLLFFVLSEIPYDMAMFGQFFYPGKQNVYGTLFLSLIGIWLSEELQRRQVKSGLWIGLFLTCALSWLLKTDYYVCGIVLAFMIRGTRYEGKVRWLGIAIVLLFFGGIDSFAVLALPFMMLYNGERGTVKHKYFFYAFYPVHLLLLGLWRILW